MKREGKLLRATLRVFLWALFLFPEYTLLAVIFVVMALRSDAFRTRFTEDLTRKVSALAQDIEDAPR